MPTRYLLLSFLVLISGLLFIGSHLQFFNLPAYSMGQMSSTDKPNVSERGSILFLGDVLLARGVETLMESKGASYPFDGISQFTKSADVTIGNFEASIPAIHAKTPNFQFQFSVEQQYMAQLIQAGFDGLSLANNHSYDFGDAGYQHTLETCLFYDLDCFGHPYAIDLHSTNYYDLDGIRVGVLALNATDDTFDRLSLGATVSKMSSYSDVQIVFVHWGIEYEDGHSDSQKKLAHALIDNGVDAIIGHHPHVVQDIEIYNKKPIFYSLGNFIFDQYSEDSLQKGLMVTMRFFDDSINYELRGVTSIHSKSQPQPMTSEENDAFMKSLSVKTDHESIIAIKSGQFSVGI